MAAAETGQSQTAADRIPEFLHDRIDPRLVPPRTKPALPGPAPLAPTVPSGRTAVPCRARMRVASWPARR